MLNSRMKIILRELMTAEAPISSNYLANLNQVSSRTARQDIKDLNGILSGSGALIESVMGKGYRLGINHDKLFRDFLKETLHDSDKGNQEIPRTPEERINYLIKRLLLSEGFLKLDDLAEELYISKSTIQNDIKEIRKKLARYKITLESRPNYGLKVKGNEVKLRFCMAEYIFDRNEPIIEPYLDSISQADIEEISQIIMRKIKVHQITLSDIAMNNLLIHIAIAYNRIESGYHVSLQQEDLKEITDQYEYEVAKEIVKEVEHHFQVNFPSTEIAYIAIHLLGTKIASQSDSVVEQVMDPEIMELVTIALEKVEEKLNLELKDDKELVFALCLHLKPAINRFRYDMNLRNPMLEDIKKNYPLAFEAGIIAGIAIEEHTSIKIDEGEVGYLAIHLGAAIERKKLTLGPKRCLIVCGSGMGTAKLIYYKLNAQFGQFLDIVGTTEYYTLSQYNFEDIDFIVSSIPISINIPVPVIEVNAILRNSDLLKIENRIMKNKQLVYSYLQKDLVFLQKNFTTKEAVLEFLNEELLKKDLVDDDLLEAVYEREKIAPTAFGNLVAVPHPITPKSARTFIAICTLEKPIQWGEKSVQFVGLLCVKKDSQEDLQNMYDRFGQIIDSSTVVEQLVKAGTYEEFMKVFRG
ncbi:BglG family transcription antiterminator [Oceanobacillus massiliensis]|uniref:BglG family transcription antiterminator n=1 Tax=Oceanobacillus massiliensis TaxID=1465765 RepID=UPI0002894FB9|nr:BglG family transcription antiterminator [Oceanobacillus massiliensis]